MNFLVRPEVFEALPELCVGVVVAKGADNSKQYPPIEALLDSAIGEAEARFAGKKVREESEILPYREAFRALSINPNKYMCSIEALFTRIAKGKGMPHISPLVDLNNAVSLRHTLPMGTHDLGISDEDIEIRYAEDGDVFIPFGSDETEAPDPGELVYAVGHDVRTRRWTWRQSEHGKIGPETGYVFFPIDGFLGFNEKEVAKAAEELEALLKEHFGCETLRGSVDREHPSMDLTL